MFIGEEEERIFSNRVKEATKKIEFYKENLKMIQREIPRLRKKTNKRKLKINQLLNDVLSTNAFPKLKRCYEEMNLMFSK